MTVAVGPDALQVVHEGESVYFCSAQCKARFEAEPDRYSPLRAP